MVGMRAFPSCQGSSPLTRGKRRATVARPLRLGLIPAHAGKTPASPPEQQRAPAHPRSRGENLSLSATLFDEDGSSPLTRGKHDEVTVRRARRGLIPAHAGKTPTPRSARSSATAHPRSRGENGPLPADGMELDGSSPLTRGKPPSLLIRAFRAGLIPAHAGKTTRRSAAVMRRPAHPRSRGENRGMRPSGHSSGGSSPLTRGKPPAGPRPWRRPGLIPAHAGKTS